MRSSGYRGLLAAALVASAIAPAIFVGGAQAQDKGQVVVASFGGRFQDAQRKAVFEPFEKATGIKVVEQTGVSVSKVAAMVRANNAEWDTHLALGGEYLVMSRAGWLEKIDYGQMDMKQLEGIPKSQILDYGVGWLEFGVVIAYNTKAYTAATAPKTWADVWDPVRFPGKRYFSGADQPSKPIELALMADGVPFDKIYPIDLERAYKMLEKINPHVAKWGTSASQGPQAYIDGEAVIGMGGSARLTELIREGAPIGFHWNEAVIEADYWVVPKGAKNYKNAMKFIEFASRPEIVAELAKIIPYGPVNVRALDHLTPAQRAELPAFPENRKNTLEFNAEWWAGADANGRSNHERNLALWTRFISTRR